MDANARDRLTKLEAVTIRQRVDWVECVTNALGCTMCEQSNEYRIFGSDSYLQDDKGELGVITEESTCLCRACCLTCRSFKTTFNVNGAQIANTERPYKCPIPLPCYMPILDVFGNNGPIGQLKQKYQCCPCCTCKFIILEVLDSVGNQAYTIEGSCCQASLWCEKLCGFCKSCSRIEFKILDASGAQVGSIFHIYAGCFQELCTRADNLGIVFPRNASADHRILLINAAMFFDYLVFQA